MPRGSGKTSFAEAAALWGLLFGHRRFVVLVGASEAHAQEVLDSLLAEFEENDELAAAFREVYDPIRALDGIGHCCTGQLHSGPRRALPGHRISPALK